MIYIQNGAFIEQFGSVSTSFLPVKFKGTIDEIFTMIMEDGSYDFYLFQNDKFWIKRLTPANKVIDILVPTKISKLGPDFFDRIDAVDVTDISYTVFSGPRYLEAYYYKQRFEV